MFAHAYFAAPYFAPRYFPPAGAAPAPVAVELGAARRVLARKEKRRRPDAEAVEPAAQADAGLVVAEIESLAAAFERLVPEAQTRIDAEMARVEREGLLGDFPDIHGTGDAALRHHLRLLIEDEIILMAIRL